MSFEEANKEFIDHSTICALAGLTFLHLVDVDAVVARLHFANAKAAARAILGRDLEQAGSVKTIEYILGAYSMAGVRKKFYQDFGVTKDTNFHAYFF